MSHLLEELDCSVTPIGALGLRRWRDPGPGLDVFEIIRGDEFPMTCHFTASKVALGRLGVAACHGAGRDIVVGGLGPGHTAQAVLDRAAVRSLPVVEFLAPVSVHNPLADRPFTQTAYLARNGGGAGA
jgi:hypothetical protein